MSFAQSGGGGSPSRQLWDYQFNVNNFQAASLNVPGAGSVTLFTLTGKGIVSTIQIGITSSGVDVIPVINIDGIDYDLGTFNGTSSRRPIIQGGIQWTAGSTNSAPAIILLDVNTRFKSNFTLKMRTTSGVQILSTIATTTTYYT